MNRPAKKLIFAAIAGVFSASVAFTSNAAGLGRVTINSALGQPLAVEIELVSLQPGEVDAIAARVASPETYGDAKVEYSPLLRQLRFEIDKKADTKAVLKITSVSPISEPFLDVLVEMTWPAGKVTREYPILLDPVGFNEAKVNAPLVASQVAAVTPRTNAAASTSTAAPQAALPVTGSPSAKAEAKSTLADTYGPVKKGDTLRKIAEEMKSESISLDQMLVALYRENKSAFVDNNMNRLKTGQILKVPSAEDVAKITKGEAQKEIKVQVAAWKEFREKLSGVIATAPAKDTATTLAAGKIATAKVDLPAPAAVNKDVLKLSKPEAASGKAAASAQDRVNALKEEAIARENATKEAASRAKELEKQIADTKKLLELKAAAATAAAKQETKTVAAAEPAKADSAKPVEATPAAAKAEDAKPADATKVVEAKPAAPKAAPAVVKEPELLDQVVENAVPIGGVLGAGILAVGGFLFMRKRKQNQAAYPSSVMGTRTSSLIPSDLRASNSPTTSSGKGGLVDTGNSSFLTDFDKTGPGSIDTDEVDPVAEAEVYIAYGRDAQAEEILKEARGRDKNRHEVSLKLLEIYHARKSAPAFETVARELKEMVGSADPMWVKAATMGAQIDPANSLYGEARQAYDSTAAFAAGGAAMAASDAAAPPDVDFDLGFGTDAPVADAPLDITSSAASVDFDINAASSTSPAEADISLSTASAPSALDFDLGFDTPAADIPAAHADATHTAKPAEAVPSVFDFDLSSLSLDDNAGSAASDFTKTVASKSSVPDINEISLDLNAAPTSGDPGEGATATKLELAKAYIEIGDSDGAKEILHEVAREGSPAQQEEAKKVLASL